MAWKEDIEGDPRSDICQEHVHDTKINDEEERGKLMGTSEMRMLRWAPGFSLRPYHNHCEIRVAASVMPTNTMPHEKETAVV